MLTITDHRRDRAGLRYVYPVVSRRAGGVSIGINLNPNNACNWACLYCQVPDLTRGGPPPLDLDQLAAELDGLLNAVLTGDFLAREVAEPVRKLRDVAFSGNGEPTSAPEFAAAVERVLAVLARHPADAVPCLRLITNGSLLHRAGVRDGIARLGTYPRGGEVWFKVDRASDRGIATINDVARSAARQQADLEACCALAPTWVQTCWFALDGAAPDAAEEAAYLDLLASVRQRIRGVHLYGLARPSLQPAAPRLSALPAADFLAFAHRIEALGVPVSAHP